MPPSALFTLYISLWTISSAGSEVLDSSDRFDFPYAIPTYLPRRREYGPSHGFPLESRGCVGFYRMGVNKRVLGLWVMLENCSQDDFNEMKRERGK